MGPQTEAERGMQSAAGTPQVHPQITMSIYSVVGGQSYETDRDPYHLLFALGVQSQALHRFLSSASWTSHVNILQHRNRAPVTCKWKSLVPWKVQGFRTPVQVRLSLLEGSLKPVSSKHRQAKVEWLANRETENWPWPPKMATKAPKASQGREQNSV